MNQSNQLTTPVIEKLDVESASIKLSVRMTLASVPVTIGGWYNVGVNAYNPSSVWVDFPMPDEEGDPVNNFDLETFCEMMGWDYWTTMEVIQEAVEKRDQ